MNTLYAAKRFPLSKLESKVSSYIFFDDGFLRDELWGKGELEVDYSIGEGISFEGKISDGIN